MSNWNALPMDALWYGELVFTVDGESDYNYAYSMDTFEPDPLDIAVPHGAEILESKVLPMFVELSEVPR